MTQPGASGRHGRSTWHDSDCPVHTPARHTSPSVQSSPSSQLPPSPAEQTASMHEPARQTSPWVPLPLSHVVPSTAGLCVQAPLASQRSSVHGLLSSQLMALPTQAPSRHWSCWVHGSPSSQLCPSLVG